MTIRETAKQLHQLSNGRINGEKFKLRELEEAISHWLKTSDTYVGRILLPDGEWFFLVDKFPYERNQYDYYVPDTREHEKELVKKLLGIEI